ncbi:HDL247Cp [Eremothecium sinecaudum]|uniref:Translation initiation factor eIF2 assembly protein n=1 Tax=Eremothecium sinecaudum TaxID=45286 RepID=A0A0X8HS44_9SACH|nr:HDL247Cp [Eremothecium sinecaudum]AMD20497.1 HDL247Cp [Eremothecium sinecaudum]
MDEDFARLTEIPVSKEHIKNCAFSAWYDKFKGHTPRAVIIKPLPAIFIQYLEQDGIRLVGKDCEDSSFQKLERSLENDYSDWEDAEDGETSSIDDEEAEKPILPKVDFPELHKELSEVFNRFSAVTPKLNWSSPKDATWIIPNGTMKCKEANDIYLLLNASNYVMHDLQHAFSECKDLDDSADVEYELVLREWFDINPALEFRVFVRDGNIIGISQRDLNYYDFLAPLKKTLKAKIEEFLYHEVLEKFPDDCFVADIYIPRPFTKVWLIDINPFGRKTDPLMFSWTELVTSYEEDDSYDFRLITEHNIGRFASKEHSENQVPTDIVEASLDPDTLRELTSKWKELLSMQQNEEVDQ